jgi:hypothetical protein
MRVKAVLKARRTPLGPTFAERHLLSYKGRLGLLREPLVDAGLNGEEGNDVSLAGRTSQSIARIARTVGNLATSRDLLRAVLYPAIARSR